MINRSLAATHARLCRFGRYRLVREDPNPQLPTTLYVTHNSPPGRLNLAASHPTRFQGLQAKLAKGKLVPTARAALHPPTMLFSIFRAFWQ
jgi:hypothetical protein